MGIKGGRGKGLSRSTKRINTRAKHGEEANSIAKRGQGGIPPCGIKGQCPLWGLGQRPNCSKGDQSQGSQQQRRRQRSVPASNFALPQERPPSCSTHYLHIVAPNGRDHIAAPPHLVPTFPLQTDTQPQKIQEKPAAQNRWFFQSPEIFTSSAPPDESAGTSARSPQTRTSWGAVHAARDSAPTGRSKAECSAPATIG